MAIEVTDGRDGSLLGLKVAPGASRAALLGEYDGRLKVAVRQPPEKGRANEGVVALLARTLGIPRREIDIVSGTTSPLKTVLFRGRTADTMRERIATVLREETR